MADGKPRFYTLRKHRKKSIFFAAVGAWLVKYGVDRFRDYLTRRQFCEEAKAYSKEYLHALQKPRRLMVFFNATAGKGEAEKLFQRNAEPILHLAGLDVTIVKTDYEGQIKKLMQYIDPSLDGIVVAGGDGTLLEAVTGLLRRPDQADVSKIPIGIIPVGTNNTFFNRVFGSGNASQSRQIGNAAMTIVKGQTTSAGVMEIKGEEGRPTFALNGVHWGAFRDTAESYDKYWITGPLRQKMAYIAKTFQGWPPVSHARISYPINAPSPRHALSITPSSSPGSLTWRDNAHAMASTAGATSDGGTESDGWITRDVETLGLMIEPVMKSLDSMFIRVKIWPQDMAKIDFIRRGWKMEKRELTSEDESDVDCFAVQELKFVPRDNEESWFSIDGEPFDARTIHIKYHPDKLIVFSA
ncbi:predicted protein [Nematostella vectensis]|uniref:Acylglycerol kinase, mitochondrial n=1 Tax=Nematostella vectensis TaxID=45351 RepID=A7S3K0_NEMVE|nr:acylglycerol kinase, mitochondrial [Nematostella vectensis]EDO41738.1 predicted protein [Nematostella vectensis]|eukprot:XP_001633801.1 predicted protein [Nematostella vectensis]